MQVVTAENTRNETLGTIVWLAVWVASIYPSIWLVGWAFGILRIRPREMTYLFHAGWSVARRDNRETELAVPGLASMMLPSSEALDAMQRNMPGIMRLVEAAFQHTDAVAGNPIAQGALGALIGGMNVAWSPTRLTDDTFDHHMTSAAMIGWALADIENVDPACRHGRTSPTYEAALSILHTNLPKEMPLLAARYALDAGYYLGRTKADPRSLTTALVREARMYPDLLG